MWIFKLCYLLFLIGLTVFYVLYIDSLALVVLMTALILPVLLKLCLIWLKHQSKTSLSCNKDSCAVGQSVPVSLILENDCPLSFAKATAKIRIQHVFSDKAESIRLRFPVHGRNTTRLTFWIKAECCGAVRISLEKIHVLDYFCLFRTNIRKQSTDLELLILPERLQIPLLEQAESVYAPESNQYANKAGDDPSEIFNIREYHAGDAVSRIHWKLSSKSEEHLFLKEFGYPVEKQVLLLAEYLPQPSADSIQQMKQAQAVLTLIYSIASGLAEHSEKTGMICTMAWYDGKQQRLISRDLKTLQNLRQIFQDFYHSLNDMICNPQVLHDALTGKQFSSVTLVTNHNSDETIRMLEQQISAYQKNLLIMTEKPAARCSDWVTLQTIHPEAFTEHSQEISEIVI